MMDVLGGLLKSAAPALATAVLGPAGPAAVSLIAKTLGVEDSVEAVTSHLQANPGDAIKLKELDLKELEIHAKDRDSARQREMIIATSEAAPYINKIITPTLALGIIGLSFFLFGILIFVDVKPEAKDILIYILGVLSALVTQVTGYYFGSSQGSKDKDALKGLFK